MATTSTSSAPTTTTTTWSSFWTRSTIYHRHQARRQQILERLQQHQHQQQQEPQHRPLFLNATKIDREISLIFANDHFETDFQHNHSYGSESALSFYDSDRRVVDPAASFWSSVGFSSLAAVVAAQFSNQVLHHLSFSNWSVPTTTLHRTWPSSTLTSSVVLAPSSFVSSLGTGPATRPFAFVGTTKMGSLSFGLLMGTWVGVDHMLSNSNSNVTHRSNPLVSVASSAVAGTALAVAQVLSRPRMAHWTIFSRHALAATLYLEIYQKSRQHSNNDWRITAGAGALAGSVYHCLTGSSFAKGVSPFATATPSPVSSRVLMRVAPAHALFFVSYETLKELFGLPQE